MYYRGAAAAIVVYDITNPVWKQDRFLFCEVYVVDMSSHSSLICFSFSFSPSPFLPPSLALMTPPQFFIFFRFQQSFQQAKKWVKELQHKSTANIVIALAGNKVDLKEKRKVSEEEARAYSDENGLLFFETSAKLSFNVNELFCAIGNELNSFFFYLFTAVLESWEEWFVFIFFFIC